MAWIIQGGQLINDEFINAGTKPFVGDSPLIMWRYKSGESIPYHPLMHSFSGTKPFVGDSPYTMWRIDPNANGGTPYSPLMIGVAKLPEAGAFEDATQLKRVVIPKSCKKIGERAFQNTQLKSVTIASDCRYSPTSFPEGCVINFYPD